MTKYTKAMSQEEMISRLKSLHIELRYMVDAVEAIKKNIEYKYYINGIKTSEEDAEWIPCSERLPSESGDYLCCNKGYLPYIAHYYGGQWHDFEREVSRVDAWMPLPKPYKGGDEE